jgi:hypothetical protein
MFSVAGFFGREFDSPRLHHFSFNIFPCTLHLPNQPFWLFWHWAPCGGLRMAPLTLYELPKLNGWSVHDSPIKSKN